MGTDVEKLMSFLSFMKQSLQPGLLLSLGSALCTGFSQVGQYLWSFKQEFPTHQNIAYSFPKLQLKQRNVFQGIIPNPFPHAADSLSRNAFCPYSTHCQILNLAAKFPFSLQEEERSQRLQLAGHKHCVATL